MRCLMAPVSLPQPPSPFKAPLVVEWAPGVMPKPDRATLGRHVEQLVEVSRGPRAGRGGLGGKTSVCIALPLEEGS